MSEVKNVTTETEAVTTPSVTAPPVTAPFVTTPSPSGIYLTPDELKTLTEATENVMQLNENRMTFENAYSMEIVGSPEQKQIMLTNWASYLGEIKNPENTATNPYHKSMYAPLDEVLNTTRPVLSKFGFGMFQYPLYENGIVSVSTVLVHTCGGVISFPPMNIPVAKADAQGVVAAVTYGRRAALNPILATYGEYDDDGNTASGLSPNQGSDAAPAKKSTGKAKKNPEIEGLVDDITATAKALIANGVTKEEFYSVIQEKCGTKQYNLVTDADKLKEALAAVMMLEAKA